MDKIKKLQELLKKALDKMTASKELIAAAGEDAAKVELAKKGYEESKGEYERVYRDLNAAVEEAEQEVQRKKLDGRIGNIGKVIDPTGGTGIVPENEPGGNKGFDGVRDHEREETERVDLFCKFLQKGHTLMSDRELDALQPVNKELANKAEGVCSVIPKVVIKRLFPEIYLGKALPMTSGDNDAAGGRANLLYPDYGSEIRSLPTENPSLFQRVRVVPCSGGEYKEPRLAQDDANEYAGVAVQWVDEAADAPDTEMNLSMFAVKCYNVKAYTSVTRTLLSRQRWDMLGPLTMNFRKALMTEFDKAIAFGSGTGQPLGLRTVAGTRNVPREEAGKVSYSDLVKLKHAVKSYHRNGATYMLGDGAEEALELVRDTTGRPIFRSSTADGPYDRLLTYPYFVTSHCAELGSRGDVLFGNLRHYLFALEEEVVIARSEHAEFKKGGIAFRLDAMAGGKPEFERCFAFLSDPV